MRWLFRWSKLAGLCDSRFKLADQISVAVAHSVAPIFQLLGASFCLFLPIPLDCVCPDDARFHRLKGNRNFGELIAEGQEKGPGISLA